MLSTEVFKMARGEKLSRVQKRKSSGMLKKASKLWEMLSRKRQQLTLASLP